MRDDPLALGHDAEVVADTEVAGGLCGLCGGARARSTAAAVTASSLLTVIGESSHTATAP